MFLYLYLVLKSLKRFFLIYMLVFNLCYLYLYYFICTLKLYCLFCIFKFGGFIFIILFILPSVSKFSCVVARTDCILQHTNSVISSSLSKECSVSVTLLNSHSQSFLISPWVKEQAISKTKKHGLRAFACF